MSRVRIAVIDSGLQEERQGDAYITYQNFIEKRNDAYTDNPQHGTNSVDLIRKVYGRADLYVAKVFQGDEADGNTSKYMANVSNRTMSPSCSPLFLSITNHTNYHRRSSGPSAKKSTSSVSQQGSRKNAMMN
jgi:hypothetical protein